MKMGSSDITHAIGATLRRMEQAFQLRPVSVRTSKPLLVAVSKTKPVEDILEAYAAGQRHFGENYIQELVEKASHPTIIGSCKDIKWHFIGHIQSNKVNKLVKIPRLYMIETVDNEKVANNLNNAWGQVNAHSREPLRVLVQVNVSEEDAKNGVKSTEVCSLFQHIRENLPNLCAQGVMSIGRFDHNYETGANPDFIKLMQCHGEICETFCLEPTEVHVSMGMSNDFEQAIEMGSSIVRVGSSIFGVRSKKNES